MPPLRMGLLVPLVLSAGCSKPSWEGVTIVDPPHASSTPARVAPDLRPALPPLARAPGSKDCVVISFGAWWPQGDWGLASQWGEVSPTQEMFEHAHWAWGVGDHAPWRDLGVPGDLPSDRASRAARRYPDRYDNPLSQWAAAGDSVWFMHPGAIGIGLSVDGRWQGDTMIGRAHTYSDVVGPVTDPRAAARGIRVRCGDSPAVSAARDYLRAWSRADRPDTVTAIVEAAREDREWSLRFFEGPARPALAAPPEVAWASDVCWRFVGADSAVVPPVLFGPLDRGGLRMLGSITLAPTDFRTWLLGRPILGTSNWVYLARDHVKLAWWVGRTVRHADVRYRDGEFTGRRLDRVAGDPRPEVPGDTGGVPIRGVPVSCAEVMPVRG